VEFTIHVLVEVGTGIEKSRLEDGPTGHKKAEKAFSWFSVGLLITPRILSIIENKL